MGYNFGLTYSSHPVFVLGVSGAKISCVVQGPKLSRKRVGGCSTNKVDVRDLSGMNLQINDIVMVLMELLDRFSTEKSASLDIFMTIEQSFNVDIVAQCITCLFVSLWEAKIPLKNYIICTSISLIQYEGEKETIATNSHDVKPSQLPVVIDRCYIGTSIDTGTLSYIYCTNHSKRLNQFIKMGIDASKSLGCDIKKLIKW